MPMNSANSGSAALRDISFGTAGTAGTAGRGEEGTMWGSKYREIRYCAIVSGVGG